MMPLQTANLSSIERLWHKLKQTSKKPTTEELLEGITRFQGRGMTAEKYQSYINHLKKFILTVIHLEGSELGHRHKTILLRTTIAPLGKTTFS